MKKQIIIIFLGLFLFASGCSRSDLDLWRAKILSRQAERNSAEAIKLYQDALRTHPSGPKAEEIHFKLGSLFMKSGDFNRAIDELSATKTIEGKRLLARALMKNGDYTGALEVFGKCGDKGPDEYIFDYAVAAEKSNLFDLALRLYSYVKTEPGLKGKALQRVSEINLIIERSKYAGLDEEVRKAIENSPAQKDYPDASAVYLFVDEKIEMTEEKREITEFHYCLKILNDRGKEAFAEIDLPYDSTYEKLEVEYARTIKPDGTVVTVGDKNIRDVSAYLNYPLYSNARVRIISMPEIVPGSYIEYKAKITRSKLPNDGFDSYYWLQADEPILLERSKIVIPKSKSLKYKIVNDPFNTFGFDMTPSYEETADKKIYS
ncbi:MAG TPA: DUF3857 domain-containing protein, partial [Candidatus Omnitrophota bacterium]|nr:DUF3857 domain-containing protein [Candidatus Omnitrophota bacterium]